MRRHLCFAALLLNTREIALYSLQISVQLGKVAIVLLVNLFNYTLEVVTTAQLRRRMPAYVITRTATKERLSSPACSL